MFGCITTKRVFETTRTPNPGNTWFGLQRPRPDCYGEFTALGLVAQAVYNTFL